MTQTSTTHGDLPVLILAGGLGSRLAPVVASVPKVMAPIGGRPFLDLLLSWLASSGLRDIWLSLGVRASGVIDYLGASVEAGSAGVIFNTDRGAVDVHWLVESEPLGTLGALAFCLREMRQRAGREVSELCVVNGDTWMDADLSAFIRRARAQSRELALLAVGVPDCGRYGALTFDKDGILTAFQEKSLTMRGQPGWINGGVCYLRGAALDAVAGCERGAFEADFLARQAPGRIWVDAVNCDFIDIGTPESFEMAQDMLVKASK